MTWAEDRRYYLVRWGGGPVRIVGTLALMPHERVLASGTWEAMQTARRLLLLVCS